MQSFKKNLTLGLLLIIIFILTSSRFAYCLNATCVNGVVTCTNGGSPVCGSDEPICTQIGAGCRDLGGSISGPVSCSNLPVCNSFSLVLICSSLGLSPNLTTCMCTEPTYTCNPGFTSCPDNMTKGVCCAYGCCPSNPSLCKCLNSNECFPNCTLPTPTPVSDPQPTPVTNPTPAQCNDGIDNDGDGLTDLLHDPGCSDLSDDDESNPIPTPIGTPTPATTSKASIQLSNFGKIKRNSFTLSASLNDFPNNTQCSVTSKIGALSLATVPTSFTVSSSSNRTIRVLISKPIQKFIRRSNSRTITTEINCSSAGIKAQNITNVNL